MGGNLAPELKRLLSEAGCRFERHGKGDQKIKSRHTANAVLKQAGLPKQF